MVGRRQFEFGLHRRSAAADALFTDLPGAVTPISRNKPFPLITQPRRISDSSPSSCYLLKRRSNPMPHRHASEEFDRLEALRQDDETNPILRKLAQMKPLALFAKQTQFPPPTPTPALQPSPPGPHPAPHRLHYETNPISHPRTPTPVPPPLPCVPKTDTFPTLAPAFSISYRWPLSCTHFPEHP